jgi:peptide/nickel transport system substrate-binding protein
MQRRTFLAVASAALAAPMLSRAGATQVLRFIPAADLTVLDPIWTTDYRTRNHGFAVFDTLYGQTGPAQGFKVTPQMLAGHSMEDDGRTWRLTLREGLLFHDGQKVLARDCVASVRRWSVRDAFGQALMQRTDELRALDDRVITFRLKQPFPLLPDALGKVASNMCAIMPERLALTDPFKQVPEVVGSGPFRFKAGERIQGSLAVYERFRDYKPVRVGPRTGRRGQRWRISIVSNGTPFPIPQPH